MAAEDEGRLPTETQAGINALRSRPGATGGQPTTDPAQGAVDIRNGTQVELTRRPRLALRRDNAPRLPQPWPKLERPRLFLVRKPT